MNKTSNTIGKIFVILILLTTVTLVNVNVFERYANMALYVNFAFAMFGLVLCRKFRTHNFSYIALTSVYLLLSVLVSNGGIGSVITFIVPLLLLTSFSFLKFSRKSRRALILIGLFTVLILFAYSFPYSANFRAYFDTKINSNTLGMFIMFFFMIVCVCIDLSRAKMKLLVTLMLVISIWGMYNYESRGTTLAVCCFALTLMLPSKFFTRNSFFTIVFLLIALGTAFPVVYLHLYNIGYTAEVFGKSLYTGREGIWSTMFSLMKDDTLKILFGMGSKTVLWNHALNVHNNFFNIIVNFGVFGFVIYYAFILQQIWNAAKNIKNPTVRKSLSMFVCSVLILGFSETTSLWSVIFPFAYFGLIVANSEKRSL